jgi:hypothetical protein
MSTCVRHWPIWQTWGRPFLREGLHEDYGQVMLRHYVWGCGKAEHHLQYHFWLLEGCFRSRFHGHYDHRGSRIDQRVSHWDVVFQLQFSRYLWHSCCHRVWHTRDGFLSAQPWCCMLFFEWALDKLPCCCSRWLLYIGWSECDFGGCVYVYVLGCLFWLQ